MDKVYNPHAIEQHWYRIWEEQGAFAPNGNGTPYCIMIPPPNVTGSLHMGHAFQDTLMDALIRYHRMLGDNTLWQAGTDHAGIATQMVVERQLKGQTRHEIGRSEFIQRIWQWKAHSGGRITAQLRRMGASLDWSRERFTMDAGLSAAVSAVFVRLYDEGLIYRGQRLVNWDPILHTAISDLEVVSQEEDGFLWHIRYPVINSCEFLIVATTRPETLLGDSALAVHPDDNRYRHLIGQYVALPLTDRIIPIIADSYVDPNFGTGCLKITPAHDFNDYAVGQRHNLPLINIFTPDAHLNENAPIQYQGIERFAARQKIITDLTAAGLLEKVQAHKLMVPRGDRTHAVIEPFLTYQWYVRIAPLAEPAIRAVADGRIRFIPDNWAKTYFEWMRNIQDWCISRQIWWGHRIPAWYDDNNQIYVAHSETEARVKYHLPAELHLRQDEDVLDTWFSSALWPFSTLGWPDATPEFATFYPTSVLITGFDIIFFWVARMIMMGLKFTGAVPFREVYIHGLVRDAHGQKMSKSKGNVLDPIDLIDGIELENLVAKRTAGLMQPEMAEKIAQATRAEYPNGIPSFGADALRFTFAALASTGRDINFEFGRIGGYRNYCNKLWNAARYVLINTEGHDLNGAVLNLPDRWIISRLERAIVAITSALNEYRFDLAANALYEFTWNEYCDWYVEFSKPILTGDISLEMQRGTRRTLLYVLETLLRLAHPLIPFITEEIWQKVAPLTGQTLPTLMGAPYPHNDNHNLDSDAESEINWIRDFILAIRNIRGEMNISPGVRVTILLQYGADSDRERIARNQSFIYPLARIDSIRWLDNSEKAPPAATALVGTLHIFLPLAGLIDTAAECKRLDKEIERLNKEQERIQAKLANPNFVERAPAEIVAKERERHTQIQTAWEKLTIQRQNLQF